MGYRHFGSIGDMWKHLPLCDVAKIEDIEIYVETNAAYFDYSLTHSPEQLYGIGHFIERSNTIKHIQQTEYYKLIEPIYRQGKYLGSCGQMMNLLKRQVKKYVFFDIDVQAIDSINNAVHSNGFADIVETRNSDSATGLINLISELNSNAFIHIDPYEINTPNENGDTYIDGFVKASKKLIKCFLWYGFTTLKEKRELNSVIIDNVKELDGINITCNELILKEIEEDNIKLNPGILGCGILTSNLSIKSRKLIAAYSDMMIDIYRNSKYKEMSGELYSDMIINTKSVKKV